MNNYKKTVGENLKNARKDAKQTQQQVADFLHMTQQQYSRFENGVFELNYDTIKSLCYFFSMTPNQLFGIDEEKIDNYLSAHFNQTTTATTHSYQAAEQGDNNLHLIKLSDKETKQNSNSWETKLDDKKK